MHILIPPLAPSSLENVHFTLHEPAVRPLQCPPSYVRNPLPSLVSVPCGLGVFTSLSNKDPQPLTWSNRWSRSLAQKVLELSKSSETFLYEKRHACFRKEDSSTPTFGEDTSRVRNVQWYSRDRWYQAGCAIPTPSCDQLGEMDGKRRSQSGGKWEEFATVSNEIRWRLLDGHSLAWSGTFVTYRNMLEEKLLLFFRNFRPLTPSCLLGIYICMRLAVAVPPPTCPINAEEMSPRCRPPGWSLSTP